MHLGCNNVAIVPHVLRRSGFPGQGSTLNPETGLSPCRGPPNDEQAKHPQASVQVQDRYGSDYWPRDPLADRRRPWCASDPCEPLEKANPVGLQRAFQPISLSGRRRCFDISLVERLWQIVKHEEIFLWAYSDDWEAEIGPARFLWRHNHVSPHSALDGKILFQVYRESKLFSSRLGLSKSGARAFQ
jgi:transposase InsO family protein